MVQLLLLPTVKESYQQMLLPTVRESYQHLVLPMFRESYRLLLLPTVRESYQPYVPRGLLPVVVPTVSGEACFALLPALVFKFSRGCFNLTYHHILVRYLTGFGFKTCLIPSQVFHPKPLWHFEEAESGVFRCRC
jgi:hypothetical protein